MFARKLKITIATLTGAFSVGIAATPVIVPDAQAAPRSVQAGSTGNLDRDDICRQMADLINQEIASGYDDELAGDFGGANAWFAQAEEHTRRAQAFGCAFSRMTRPAPARPAVVRDRAAAPSGATQPGAGPASGTTTVARKKIHGRLTTGVHGLGETSCGTIAGFVNDALRKMDAAAQAGDADAAAGWRQHANSMLAAGRAAGCEFYVRRAGQTIPVRPGSSFAK
jgi:hypothetical protein